MIAKYFENIQLSALSSFKSQWFLITVTDENL